jgi:GDP-6-deoxy-D-talose 4-dehydrogenase
MILIAGVEGFLGARIARIMQSRGFKVYGTIRHDLPKDPQPGIVYLKHKQVNLDSKVPEFEVVINAVGYYGKSNSIKDLSENIKSNCTSNLDLIKFITNKTKTVINLSSYFEFAPNPPGIPLNQYAASKILGRTILENFCKNLNVNLVSCVLYDNFSEDLRRGKLIDQLIIAANENQIMTINNFENQMDLIYVNDLIEIIAEITEQEHKSLISVYQIKSGQVFSVREIVNLINSISTKQLRIQVPEIKIRSDSIKKIWKSAPDWKSQVRLKTFKDYLEEMLV